MAIVARGRELMLVPKAGRILFFAGDMVHRGGVPSRGCPEPRLSVAFKFKARRR